MSPLPVGVATVAVILWTTNLMDCLSTIRRIRSPEQETNPLVRPLMRRVGVVKGAWIVTFAAWSLIVGCALAFARSSATATGYIALGLVVAAVQLDVARFNATGRRGPFIGLALTWHAFLPRVGGQAKRLFRNLGSED